MRSVCAFWLAALIGAASRAADWQLAYAPLTHLCSYLWLYTGASVPDSLHQPLLRAVSVLETRFGQQFCAAQHVPWRTWAGEPPLRRRRLAAELSQARSAWRTRLRLQTKTRLELLKWLLATDETLGGAAAAASAAATSSGSSTAVGCGCFSAATPPLAPDSAPSTSEAVRGDDTASLSLRNSSEANSPTVSARTAAGGHGGPLAAPPSMPCCSQAGDTCCAATQGTNTVQGGFAAADSAPATAGAAEGWPRRLSDHLASELIQVMDEVHQAEFWQSEHSADMGHAFLGITCLLRGLGLVSSCHAAAGGATRAEAALARWLHEPLSRLVAAGHAAVMARIGPRARTSQPQSVSAGQGVPVPLGLTAAVPPQSEEKYAQSRPAAVGSFATNPANPEAQHLREFSDVIAELAASGATHLPVVWRDYRPSEMLLSVPLIAMPPVEPYSAVGAWDPQLPPALARLPVHPRLNLEAALSCHAQAVMIRTGAAFAKVADIQVRTSSLRLSCLLLLQ